MQYGGLQELLTKLLQYVSLITNKLNNSYVSSLNPDHYIVIVIKYMSVEQKRTSIVENKTIYP